ERAEIAVLQERRRMARDLHDGVAQELAYISRLLRMPEAPHRPAMVRAAAERALDESRRAIAALTRPLDEPLELEIPQAAEEIAARVGGDVAFVFRIDEGIELDREGRDAVLRVTCEAVSNAIRHGCANRIEITL